MADGAERPEVVEGTVFPSSPRKAMGMVVGGVFLTAAGLFVVAWRLGEFAIANRRPGLFITIAAGFVALLGPLLIVHSLIRLVRKRRVVVGPDRVQLVETRGGADVVVAQAMFANVTGLVPVQTEAGRQLNLMLADRSAAGTLDEVNAARATPDGNGHDFVIEDQYQGRFEDLVDAVDEAVRAWRAKNEPG